MLLRPWLLQRRAQGSNAAVNAEPFLSGSSASYVEAMFESWQKDRSSVHKVRELNSYALIHFPLPTLTRWQSWDQFFEATTQGAGPGQAYQAPPTLGHVKTPQPSIATAMSTPVATDPRVVSDHMIVQAIIRAYQIRGHNKAKLDPLGISDADLESSVPPELMVPPHISLDRVSL